MNNKKLISIILPCRNEEAGVAFCLSEIKQVINDHQLLAEIIVVDNNSTDRSAEVVRDWQSTLPELRLVQESREGYGHAYLRGLDEARGEYIFMADADGSYNFHDLPRFIRELESGADLVVGNRFSHQISQKEMPWLHRYLGNPLLSGLVRKFFNIKIKDIHCGARALRADVLKNLKLYTGGMEFASEMIIRAAKENLAITEIPIKYRERLGDSKLQSFTDGWRHLRFILLYSPLILFFIPGAIIFSLGLILNIIFYFHTPIIFGIQLYFHPMFLFSLMIILGYQLMIFGGFSKVYAITHLGDSHQLIEKMFKQITITRVLLLGVIITIIGLVFYSTIFYHWLASGLDSLSKEKESILMLSLMVVGLQTIFSAFMFSILGIKNR
ncbi:MAG: glycosyltransferase family 2 protein [Patescibacteria group bacterium]|jgi:glycosyltransferase involved in cell wall biosynthesis